jgi:hypothetical protein
MKITYYLFANKHENFMAMGDQPAPYVMANES